MDQKAVEQVSSDAAPEPYPLDRRSANQSAHAPLPDDDFGVELIFVAFVCHPEWIRDWLRFLINSIETIADQVPEPWVARLEIMLRELGGVIWIQIASTIVLLRLIIQVPFHFGR